MSVFLRERFRNTARRYRNIFFPGALILMYHRVIELESDPWGLAVTPGHFAEHLEILRKNRIPTSLPRLAHDLQEGRPSSRAVVVTFDDGYADNLHNALPILERYEIPGTFFVVSSFLGQEREFWWDELERILLQPAILPAKLELEIEGRPFCWELEHAADYSESDFVRNRAWIASWQPPPTPRHALYLRLHGLLLPMLDIDRRKLLAELQAWSGSRALSRPANRALSIPELKTIARSGFVEVGAHTVTHPFLSAHPLAVQQLEVQQSKDRLEELTGGPVSSFSYPYGGYTAETIGAVREAGFTCACLAWGDAILGKVDRYQLPRVAIKDWTGEEFARRLSRGSFD